MKLTRRQALLGTLLSPIMAQQRAGRKAPFQAQSPSTLKYGIEDNAEVIEITNVNFELVWSNSAGRTPAQNMILRKSTKRRQVVGDMGMEATATVEAWPLGTDLKQPPLYSLRMSGDEPSIKNNEVLVIPRGLEEIQWWSVYRVGTGSHLFDTYVPLLAFENHGEYRYAGLEVPPDDSKDTRLKAPNVVGVISYGSSDKLLREALITCDDPKRAQLLRSFGDCTPTLVHSGSALRLNISENYPARALALISVPVGANDLDLAHAQVPQGLHISASSR